MKKLIWIVLAGTGLSCSNPENKNVVTAQKMFDAFNQHNWKTMADYYVDNALFLDPSFGTAYVPKTRREIIEKYQQLQALFPNLHDEVVGFYPSGDKVTVEFISTGNAGDSLSFQLPIITVLTFKDDVIVKDATYYDLKNP